MPTLQVPNAELFYETSGRGPILLLIIGANGTGSVFREAAVFLARNYTVICWDRRGYSKSLLLGPQDFANRLSTDADDARLLIQHLSDEPVLVFGTSSGAIVAQNLLIRHPESVKTVVIHEPPSLSVLPEVVRPMATGLIQQVYDTYRASGPSAGMQVFLNGLSEGEDGPHMRHSMDITRGDEIRANVLYWFEFELRQYTSSPLDVTRLIAEKDKFIPAAGVESGDGPGVGPIAVISGILGKNLNRLPGGHLPFKTVPEEFANALHGLLTGNQPQQS